MFRTLTVVLVLVALAGCGGDGTPTTAPTTAPTTGPTTGPTTAPTTGPTTAPPVPGAPLSGTSLDGETVSLADFRGKPVFVNVWSSW
jgi:predicted small lipoprotein YifL